MRSTLLILSITLVLKSGVAAQAHQHKALDSTLDDMKTRNGPDYYLVYAAGVVRRDNLKRISVGDIDGVEIPRKKCAKWIGLGVGSAVDVAIIIAGIAISTSSFGGFGG